MDKFLLNLDDRIAVINDAPPPSLFTCSKFISVFTALFTFCTNGYIFFHIKMLIILKYACCCFLFLKDGPLKITYFMYMDLNITPNLKKPGNAEILIR